MPVGPPPWIRLCHFALWAPPHHHLRQDWWWLVPKMSSQMFLFLIRCLSLLGRMMQFMAQWSASSARHPKDSSLCLSGSPWRRGASEDCSDGQCAGGPCVWPSRRPLDIMGHLTALLPGSLRNIDPCCWPTTHRRPRPCSTKENEQLPVLSYRLCSVQHVWGSRRA